MRGNGLLRTLERVTGIEPASRAWEARILPLNYTRMKLCIMAERTRAHT